MQAVQHGNGFLTVYEIEYIRELENQTLGVDGFCGSFVDEKFGS